ncbi:MAG TPA: amidohydrolase [Ktedonobacterales bacterium]|nr:amidohydrolase [Ktedonobacterales bacterium]
MVHDDELRAEIAASRPEMVALRRRFHERPETAFEERETAREIARRLGESGLEVREGVGKTGVVGLLRGGAGAGKTLLVRADIDALPVTEANDTPYRSQTPGKMHACGHDGHITIALTLADLLARRREQFAGNVKFAFQPAEELAAGAQPMLDDGVMRDPDVDGVIGLHIWSQTPVGDVVVQAGPFFASADHIVLRVRGRGGHGAMPHLNVDPLVAAAQIIVALQTLISREISPFHPAVLTFGSIHGGTASNVTADEVELQGTVRAYDDADRELLLRRIGEVARSVAEGLRAGAELTTLNGTPASVNDPTMTELIRRAAVATVGEARIPAGDQRQSVSDDMALFLRAVPGCYFLVGAGNVARGITAPHHSAHFDIDEDALPIGVEVMARAALEYLAPR